QSAMRARRRSPGGDRDLAGHPRRSPLHALPSTATLQDGLPVRGGPGSYALVSDSVVATWVYPGEYLEYLASPGPQPTVDGYLLAHAMRALPVQRVQQVPDQ